MADDRTSGKKRNRKDWGTVPTAVRQQGGGGGNLEANMFGSTGISSEIALSCCCCCCLRFVCIYVDNRYNIYYVCVCVCIYMSRGFNNPWDGYLLSTSCMKSWVIFFLFLFLRYRCKNKVYVNNKKYVPYVICHFAILPAW